MNSFSHSSDQWMLAIIRVEVIQQPAHEHFIDLKINKNRVCITKTFDKVAIEKRGSDSEWDT